jgi:hypothetical protein
MLTPHKLRAWSEREKIKNYLLIKAHTTTKREETSG